jgi:hypothetical protein
LHEGQPFETDLSENATWHVALAHAIAVTLKKRGEASTVPNIWKLLSSTKTESWTIEPFVNESPPESTRRILKDSDDLNERLGQAQDQVSLP